jgi:hypothetical protein
VSTSLILTKLEEGNRCSVWLTFGESLNICLMDLEKEGLGPIVGPSMKCFTSPKKVNSMGFHV